MPGKMKHVHKIKKRKDRSPTKCKTSRNEDFAGPSGTASQQLDTKKCCSIYKQLSHNCTKTYDKGGVKRIFSPFNRFAILNTLSPMKRNNTNKMTYRSDYPSTGLSPKEKSYIISSCQARFSRYTQLKNLAMNALKNNKVFIIYGNCKPLQKALTERGWVEKIPPNRMNLSKIRNGIISSQTQIFGELEKLLLSYLVEKHTPNFIWCTSEENRDTTIDMTKDCNTIINKLKIDAMWTSKRGLCASIKGNYWYFIEDVSEVNSPRTYDSDDVDELDEFIKDFKITACTSLLKWVLSMTANDRPIFNDAGTVSINVFIFAMNRCKEYLMRKQHRDIDNTFGVVTMGQWNTFFKSYYGIIDQEMVFQYEKGDKLKVYLSYSKFLLREMFLYRPQLSCEGCSNVWIIKPAHCSRGRGIRMAAKLSVITNFVTKSNGKYVVQKYIEDPLLIHDTKFDIRQYYLVTNTCPLTIWMYKDCYLKFSSQKYSLRNYHESVHLTNNAVQRKYKNCAERHPELPFNNMWDSDKYKEYLYKIGRSHVWENIIYPGMKKSIIGIMLSCQDSLYISKNRFELYGCDFVLDKEYKPWLIEINSRPDLYSTTQVTGKICPAVITDIVKVVVDYARNPKASTGRFECIYRQPVTVPRYGTVTDLVVNGNGLPSSYFYRGKIHLEKPTTKDPYFGKKAEIVNSEFDIMMDPGVENTNSNKDFEKINDVDISNSSVDLGIEDTVKNTLLHEIEEDIPSLHSFDSKTSCKRDSYTALPVGRSQITIKTVKSLADSTKSHKLATPIEYLEGCNIKTFSFSKLDDEQNGKGNNLNTQPSKCIESDVEAETNIDYFDRKFTTVTSRIVSFIKAKEKEYVRDLCIPQR